MIVYFDGVCGLCNWAVDFLISHDHKAVLKFAPLQGVSAGAHLPSDDITSLSSLVIVDGEKIYRKSDGVLHALSALGGGWPALAASLRLVPRVVRDKVYTVIATNRYTWFGQRDTCRLPTPDERQRFLD